VEGGKKLRGATLGKLAIVWDGEVYGVRGALKDAPSESNVLILSDLQAAIICGCEEGRTYRKS